MIMILLQMKKKNKWLKNIILIIYLLKVIDKLNRRKKIKKKVSDRQKKLLLKD